MLKIIFPVVAGVIIGIFHLAMGINGVAMLFGAIVILGVLNDNLMQAMQVAMLSALATFFVDSVLLLYFLGAVITGVILQKLIKKTDGVTTHL